MMEGHKEEKVRGNEGGIKGGWEVRRYNGLRLVVACAKYDLHAQRLESMTYKDIYRVVFLSFTIVGKTYHKA